MQPRLQKDLGYATTIANKADDIDTKIEKSALGSLPPVRRVISLPDKVESGDVFGAAGLASLALINLPEDIRDIKAASSQLKAIAKGEKYTPKYEYSKYQHDFSFLKGTLVQDYMKGITSQEGKERVAKIYSADKSLYNTSFGEKIKSFLGIVDGESEECPVKNIFGENLELSEIKSKSAFGELTGRAMKRMTVFGIGALAVLELPKIIKAIGQGSTVGEQTKNTAKQTVKSGINVASVAAGIGYCGAIGAKKFGATGSLIGMGIGAVVGATASQKLQEAIF